MKSFLKSAKLKKMLEGNINVLDSALLSESLNSSVGRKEKSFLESHPRTKRLKTDAVVMQNSPNRVISASDKILEANSGVDYGKI